MAEVCVNCGDPRTYARDRCRLCCDYLRKTGHDRSEEQVIRAEVRTFERESLRRRVRIAVLAAE